MNIMWKYLDKRSATIAAIKDYESMQFIIKTTDDEIKKAHEKMTSVGGAKWDGMPKVHNPKSMEDRVLNVVDEINIMEERYQQAVEYMKWFEPAWKQLSQEDKYVLENFYGNGKGYGCNAVYAIADYMKIETPTVYKRKNRALDRLVTLLFGKS